MRVIRPLAVVVVLLLACPAHEAHGTEDGNGYVYDATAAGDHRALVMDRDGRWVDIQDKADIHMDSTISEFGGSNEDCGSKEFFCLTGALEIVIPKSMPMKQWQYHGLSCQSSRIDGDSFRIVCRSPKYRGKPTFTYSRSRGVVAIDSSPVGGARGGFRLRGQYGLFSQGSHP